MDGTILHVHTPASIIQAPVSCNSLFASSRYITSIDFGDGFRTDNVTNMYHMFFVLVNLINLDASSFNTSNVTSMQSMFVSLRTLTSLDVTNPIDRPIA